MHPKTSNNDLDLVSALYEHALQGVPEAAAWLLARIARHLQADTALWLTLTDADPEAPVVRAFGAGNLATPELLQLPAPLIKGLVASCADEGRVLAYDLMQPDVSLPAMEPPRHSGARYMAVSRVHFPGTLFNCVIALYRDGIGGQRFLPEECRRLEPLLAHAVRAHQLAQRAFLNVDAVLERAGRKNRGAACLCDQTGAVMAMAETFGDLMQRHLPSWDGLRLPFALPYKPSRRDARRCEMTADGLHLRMQRVGDLNVVYARALHPFDALTSRERDIVKAMVSGQSYKTVAQQLAVSPSTVANHASNIYRKLGVYNRDDVVAMAQRRQLR